MRIENISAERFHAIHQILLQRGWQTTYIYNGMDAWIDFAEVRLRRGEVTLKFVWDNWSEGEISSEIEVEEVRALFA